MKTIGLIKPSIIPTLIGVDIQKDGVHYDVKPNIDYDEFRKVFVKNMEESFDVPVEVLEKKYKWKRSKKRNILIDNRVIVNIVKEILKNIRR